MMFYITILISALEIFVSDNPAKILKGHEKTVYSLAFSNDGEIIVSGSGDKTVKVWNVKQGYCIKTLQNSDKVRAVAISSDGEVIAGGNDAGTVTLWSTKNWNILSEASEHKEEIYSIAFSPDDKFLASAGKDKFIRLWNVEKLRVEKAFESTERVYSVAFSPDGKYLSAGNKDGKIMLFDISKSELIRTISASSGRIFSLSFSYTGEMLTAGLEDGSIIFLKVEDGSILNKVNKHGSYVRSVSCAPRVDIIASIGLDKTLQVFDKDGSSIANRKLTNAPWVVLFAPDGRYLAVNSGSDILLFSLSGKDLLAPEGTPVLKHKIEISDENGNQVFDAGEVVTIKMKIANTGKGYAYGVKAWIKPEDSEFSAFAREKFVSEIPQACVKDLEFKITVPYTVRNWSTYLITGVEDKKGNKSEVKKTFIRTSAIKPPELKFSYKPDKEPEKGKRITLFFTVQNIGVGDAWDVKVNLKFKNKNLKVIKGEEIIGNIPSAKKYEGSFIFEIPKDFKDKEIAFSYKITEKTGLFTKEKDEQMTLKEKEKYISIEKDEW